MWAQHWHHLALKVFCHKCKKNVVCDTRFSHFDSPLMGKSHTVKWIYCVYVAERDESKQARAPVHCRAAWSGGNLGETQLFSHFLPHLSGPVCFSISRSGPISMHVAKEDCLLCFAFFFPLSHNTKTNRNVRTGAQSKLATSFVYLVSGAP